MHDQTKRPVAGCGTLHGDLTRAMLLKPAPLTDAWGPYGPAQSMFRRVADVVFHDHGVPFDEDAYRRAFRTARNIVLTARREDPIAPVGEEDAS